MAGGLNHRSELRVTQKILVRKPPARCTGDCGQERPEDDIHKATKFSVATAGLNPKNRIYAPMRILAGEQQISTELEDMSLATGTAHLRPCTGACVSHSSYEKTEATK